jgi:tetratricopeptide (TPR) repeat protein
VSDRGRIEAAGEEGFWLVDAYALALSDAGRAKEAMAEFDWLVGLGTGNHSGLLTHALNRGEILYRSDRPAEALAALRALNDDPNNNASKYGRMWMLAGTVCAAHALGKADIVEQTMLMLEGLAEANLAAKTLALACMSNLEALEAILIQRLDDPRERLGVLRGFSITTYRPTSNFDRNIAATLKKVRMRPAVQAKFLEYGRVIKFDGRPSNWDTP